MYKIYSKAVFTYIGGKSSAAPEIIYQMPSHSTYVEPFAGAAHVFFAKQPVRTEVINDLDGNLINCYKVIQSKCKEFCKRLNYLLVSRQIWKEFNEKLQEPEGLSDLDRAVMYYYVQRLSFNGRVYNRSLATNTQKKPQFNTNKIKELKFVQKRLSKVFIENLSYEELIDLYNKEHTFFYCDPPYYGLPYYNFTDSDYKKLAGILGNIKGRFILSINDVPYIRDVFKDFKIDTIKILYKAARKNKKTGELLIKNY